MVGGLQMAAGHNPNDALIAYILSRRVSNRDNALIAYRLSRRIDMKLVAAPVSRKWMAETNSGFASRCLPMRIGNQAGWLILNDRPIRAKWLGGARPDSVVLEQSGDAPYPALSHFGEGILTFTIPFLFRTSYRTAILFRGPVNSPKDGIYPLEGIVETDWAVGAASMNWKFTRPNTWIEFERDEPICMIVPYQLDLLEEQSPTILDISENHETKLHYDQWRESFTQFNKRLRTGDPEAVKLGWQRYYFRGCAPHNASSGEVTEGHRTRLNLREFEHAVPVGNTETG